MEYEYNGISYYIEKNTGESDDGFFARSWYIIKQEPKTIEEYSKAVKESEIWSNYKNLGCKYAGGIQEKIEYNDKNKIFIV